MPARRVGSRLAAALAAVSVVVAATPCQADDTTTGVLAGLGLTAATGKTTLGDGAGGIEASVLGSDAFLQAGAVIAAIVNGETAKDQANGRRRVLLLAHDDAVNLNQPDVVLQQIASVKRLYEAIHCPLIPKPSKDGSQNQMVELRTILKPSDVVGAAVTDTAISALKLTADDRMLISSVILNQASIDGLKVADWAMPKLPDPKHPTPVPLSVAHQRSASTIYVLPADLVEAPLSGKVLDAYNELLGLEQKVGCATAEATAAVKATDALITSLNTNADKGIVTPLVSAIQNEAIRSNDAWLLRVAIEQVGGTSITHSGVIYTLGFPGAVTVSSGLLVTFRLTDPSSGEIKAMGMVRCALPPTQLQAAHDIVLKPGREMACSYQATAV